MRKRTVAAIAGAVSGFMVGGFGFLVLIWSLKSERFICEAMLCSPRAYDAALGAAHIEEVVSGVVALCGACLMVASTVYLFALRRLHMPGPNQ
jgi:hypothetical protein